MESSNHPPDDSMSSSHPQRSPIHDSAPLGSTSSLPRLATAPGMGTGKGSSIFGAVGGAETTPNRFATSTNAFGLTISPASSSSSGPSRERDRDNVPPYFGDAPVSPTSLSKKRRLRRPSMLSLAQTPTIDESSPPAASTSAGPSRLADGPLETQAGNSIPPPAPSPNPFLQALQPTPKWRSSFLFGPGDMQRSTSATGPSLPFETLSTTTPPIPSREAVGLETGSPASGTQSPMELESERTSAAAGLSTLGGTGGWNHSNSTPKAAPSVNDDLELSSPLPAKLGIHRPPFTGKPLPGPLLATLISESAPAEHEMRSEARYQRMVASQAGKFPFTPRPSRGSRGRFPEMVGGDDDDDDDMSMSLSSRRPSWNPRGWLDRGGMASSDSEDDDLAMEQDGVQSAFAAGMDLERPGSAGSGVTWAMDQGSGKSTPGHTSLVLKNGDTGQGQGQNQPTPPLGGSGWSDRFKASRMSFGSAGAGLAPSPGGGFGLPGAFGSLGMGSVTPLASPTVEKLELATSPGTVSIASPSLMQYRDSNSGGSYRPGKRKAQAEDRYDPYKRPRGVSPALSNAGSVASMMSPSRNSPAIPIPSSPSHAPVYYPSTLSSSNPMRSRHHYTRPISSRSRQASPALSIGSASGVISTSLGAGAGASTHRGSFAVAAPLGGTFVPAGTGKPVTGPDLGGLGLLSLQGASGVGETVEEEDVEELELGSRAGDERGPDEGAGEGGDGDGEGEGGDEVTEASSRMSRNDSGGSASQGDVSAMEED